MTESTDKQLPDEQQLNEYLKGDSSVSQQYRQLHSAEVPGELDRLVLRRAEDALKGRPAQSRPAWVRWSAPLAVAASAVLVLSIVIETGVRDETAVLQAPQPMQAKQRERAESKAEETIVNVQTAPASGFVPPAEVAFEPPMADAAPSPEIAPAAPPPPKLEVPAPEALRPNEVVVEATKPVAENVQNTPMAFVVEDHIAQGEVTPAAPPPAAQPTIRPARSVNRAAEDAEKVLQSLEDSAEKKNPSAEDARLEEGRAAAQMAYSRQISAPLPPPPQIYMDPEAWLKDIRQLRKDNKQEQADREWRRFLAAFPNYEVAETDTAREAKK